MAKKEFSKEELRKLIINFLFRKGCWGNRYFPLDTLVNWLSQGVKNNGKNILRTIKELVKERFMLTHKVGKTISLNPEKINLIKEMIEIINRSQ